MKTTKNIARLAVTAGLTAALSFSGVMAPVTMVFAAAAPVATTSGNVTIDEKTYTDTTFKGIQISQRKSRRIRMEIPGRATRRFPISPGHRMMLGMP